MESSVVDNELLKRMLLSSGFKQFLSAYNVYISIALAITTLTAIGMLVFHIVSLAKAGDNPQKRGSAISGIWISSLSLALLGGIDTVYIIVIRLIMGDLV